MQWPREQERENPVGLLLSTFEGAKLDAALPGATLAYGYVGCGAYRVLDGILAVREWVVKRAAKKRAARFTADGPGYRPRWLGPVTGWVEVKDYSEAAPNAPISKASVSLLGFGRMPELALPGRIGMWPTGGSCRVLPTADGAATGAVGCGN